MAIYRVSGQMLQSTLVRDGNNIAFADTASSTATLFVDIANTRVGVNSNVANVTLDVNGNIFALNLSSTGNVTASNINGTVVSATGNIIGGNVKTAGLISATGNVIGGNILTGGLISATGNATVGNISATNYTGTTVSITGNITSGNVNTSLVSATGNVTAGNVVVGNILIPSTGNVTLGNVNINYLSTPVANSDAATKGYVDSQAGATLGNITISNTTITTSLANGNITLTATGTQLVQVSGNLGLVLPYGNTTTRPSPATTGTIRFNTTNLQLEVWDGFNWIAATNGTSVISNQTLNGDGSTTIFSLNQSATAESILVSVNGVLQTPGVDYTTSLSPDIITFTTAPAAGDVVQIRFITTTTVVSALYNGTSNINIPVSSGNATISIGGTSNVMTVTSTGANIIGYANITGNITVGNISATGNVTGNYILGNGALLTGVITSVANINNGTSNVTVVSSGSNVTVGVGGTANVVQWATTGEYITGVVSASGNITGGNVLTAGLVSATANVTGGNIRTGGLVSSTGNITGGNLLTGGLISSTGNVAGPYFIGNISTNSIINSGSNGTGNIGSSSTYFDTIFAKATSAQYADLAELYSADAVYESGTVVTFGGDYEVTIATKESDPCIAGVVSTNPSYIMNAGIFCEFPTQVALTGRVPCRVIGPVTKGAMMVSTGNGCAKAEKFPAMGTVIGKALEAFDGAEGTIEIVVGRL